MHTNNTEILLLLIHSRKTIAYGQPEDVNKKHSKNNTSKRAQITSTNEIRHIITRVL